jgi:hypothetical protein
LLKTSANNKRCIFGQNAIFCFLYFFKLSYSFLKDPSSHFGVGSLQRLGTHVVDRAGGMLFDHAGHVRLDGRGNAKINDLQLVETQFTAQDEVGWLKVRVNDSCNILCKLVLF